MLNVKHSPITYTRNELLSMRASACLRPYLINSINNCAIDIYRRKRRTHRGGRRKQHKINVVTTPACLTPTSIVKQHGSNLSKSPFSDVPISSIHHLLFFNQDIRADCDGRTLHYLE